MFSNIKMEEYMEFQLSSIFLSKSGQQKCSACVSGDSF